MKQWTTLIGYSLVTFTNALGFGIFTNNLEAYSLYYNVKQDTFSTIYNFGLAIQLLFFIPAMKIIQWRFDYSIFSCAYLTTCAYWLVYFSNHTFALVVASYTLNSFGQLIVLPTSIYLADIWFELQKRSFVIGMGYYMNLLGFAAGAILGTLFLGKQAENFEQQALILAIISSLIFPLSLILVKNKPKTNKEKRQKISGKHVKAIWKNKYLVFNMIAASAFMGISWSFESTIYRLDNLFTDNEIAILNLVWVLSGFGFGLFSSWLVNFWFMKTGKLKYYDWAIKTLIFFGLLGYLVFGTCKQLNYSSFPLFLILSIFIGIGSIGYYGLVYLSLLESLYPLPALLMGSLVAAFASLYSFSSSGLTLVDPSINVYYSMGGILILPWIYFTLFYETNFKRYRAYLNERQAKYELIKMEESSVKQD